MDLSSLIMGVALVALFVFPFILIGRASKKNKKQLLGKLSNLAEKHGSNIKESDFCTEFAIGMDSEGKSLFYVKGNKNEELMQAVQLADIKSVRVINQNKVLSSNGTKTTIINRLALAFTPVNKDNPENQFEFYNIENKFQISSELELLNKWNDLVSLKLKG